MSYNIDSISQVVAETFGRKYAILSGRGASAIAIALRTLLSPGDKVAVPSVCCLSPVNVIGAVGMEPVICDCSPVDLNISLESVRIALESGCKAVIAVHLYGKPCEMGELEKLCREFDAFLIDDAAQAAGTLIDGRPAGSFGDAGIVSFGAGKIIPGLNGGGAVLTDDEDIMRKAAILADSLTESGEAVSSSAKTHRDIATAIQNASRPRPTLAGSYEIVRNEYLWLFEHKLSLASAEKILWGLEHLSVEIRARRERSLRYRNRLLHPLVTHIPLDEGQAVFRHTMFIGDEDDVGGIAREVVGRLRSMGIHASQHYFPTHLLIPGHRLHENYACTSPALRAVNLWVDENADDDYIDRSVETIMSVLP